jgi:hypothetical protein
MANRVRPGRLVTMMQPPCAATTASTMARPRPVLFPASPADLARPVSPRVNRSNSSGSSSGAMPGPSSVMLSSTRGPEGTTPRWIDAVPSAGAASGGAVPGASATLTVEPAGVCLPALLSRLAITWCSRCSSPSTRTGSSGRSSRQR